MLVTIMEAGAMDTHMAKAAALVKLLDLDSYFVVINLKTDLI